MPSLSVPGSDTNIKILSPTINNIMPITGNTAGGAVAAEDKERGPKRLQNGNPYSPLDGDTNGLEMDGGHDSNRGGNTHERNTNGRHHEGPEIEEIETDSDTGTDGQESKRQEGHQPNGKDANNFIKSSISTAPITYQRPAYNPSPNSPLRDAGTPRANIAPSAQSPHGTTANNYAAKNAHLTVLQQHCAFFDRDSDSIIWPTDTYRGFAALGFMWPLCLLAVFIIHANFSYPTCDSWIPDPFFRLYLKNIHMDKHGSDTNTYDHEGRYVPQKFEDIFAKHAGGREWLTIWDVGRMLRSQRCIADPIGWGGALFECEYFRVCVLWFIQVTDMLCAGLATYILLWPEDGRMMKEDIRRIYDGSIFYEVAERRAKEKKRKNA
jgi:hypothetical protein